MSIQAQHVNPVWKKDQLVAGCRPAGTRRRVGKTSDMQSAAASGPVVESLWCHCHLIEMAVEGRMKWVGAAPCNKTGAMGA
jgi:hypothetical protein